MSKAKAKMAGLSMAPMMMNPEELRSYDINDVGNELQLRAFLFSDGVLYKDGREITAIAEADLDYTTKRQVGRGASAAVYYVLEKKTQQPIALKEIPITTKTHRDEVNAELEVLAAQIHHPHILRHFGAFWQAETHCISLVMEWMAYSLQDLWRAFGRLDETVARHIAVQLVTGTAFLHDEKHVIHRDIKPSNVLVNNAGEVKLGDFGISKCVQSLHISNTYVGTQLYMAPERLEGTDYTYASDVWSVGLTLITSTTGNEPWQDEDEASPGPPGQAGLYKQMQRIMSGAVPTFPETFSGEAQDFVSKCLDRDPLTRPTCAELLKHPWLAATSIEQSREELKSLLTHVSQLACRAAGGFGSSAAAAGSLM